MQIIDAILAGVDDARGGVPPSAPGDRRSDGFLHVEPDRRAAIRYALAQAAAGDVVVIAGKGHETTQEIKGVKHPFDDREIVREYA